SLSSRPPRHPPSPSLFPYTTLFRSAIISHGPANCKHFSQSFTQEAKKRPNFKVFPPPGLFLPPSFGRSLLRAAEAAVKTGQSPVDRKSTRLNSSHVSISYAVFCLKK